MEREKINQQQQKNKQLLMKKQQIINQLALLDNQVSKVHKIRNRSVNKIDIQSNNNPQSLNLSSNDRLNSSTNNIKSIQNQQQLQNSQKNIQQNYQSQQKKVGKLILTRKQHKQLIHKLNKQREQRQKNRIKMRQKQQEKLKKIEEQNIIQQNKKKNQQRKKKIEEIQLSLQKKKQEHQNFLQKEKQSYKKYKQIKVKKFLHEQIQQKYQINIKLPLLQQQKKILRQKRQFAKAYSIDQIKNHQKSYLGFRQQSLKKSHARKQQSRIHLSQNYKAPSKSSKLANILQEQKVLQRKQLMQKKLQIQQKIHRQQSYIQYLRQNFKTVKIDKEKQEEIKSRIQKISSNKKKIDDQNQIDMKKIGMNYLQEAKKKRRKTVKLQESQEKIDKQDSKSQRNHQNIAILTSKDEKKQKSVKSSRFDQDRTKLLLKKQKQKIKLLINDTTSNQTQRIKKLKLQSQKINQAFKMKQQILKHGYSQKIQNQAVELLLTNIQAKIGIVQIYKDKVLGLGNDKEKNNIINKQENISITNKSNIWKVQNTTIE